jgi:hypothetical protein
VILPHPESDLRINIMVLGTDIIKILRKTEYVLIEDVLWEFVNAAEKRTPEMFLNTLIFLYSFGLIERRGYKIKLVKKEISKAGLN